MRRLFAAVLLMVCTLTAAASERCHDTAALYRLMFGLRDLPQSVALTQSDAFPFSLADRTKAVERVRPGGDLAHLSSSTIYQHVYLECKGLK